MIDPARDTTTGTNPGSSPGTAEDSPVPVLLRVPYATLARIPIVMLICYLLYLLLPLLMLMFMSVLLAVTLEPLIRRMSEKIGRKSAVTIIVVLIGLIITAIGLLIVPELVGQATAIYDQLPKFAESLSQRFPPLASTLNRLPQKMQNADPSALSPIVSHIAAAGGLALGGLSSLVLMFAFMVYFLLDGSRVYSWSVAFFKPKTRHKIEATCKGVVPVVSAYVIGQVVTSTLCAAFTFGLLTLLGVPAALVLAVLAGIFDVLPIIGFFLFAVPAALFALTVSTQSMIIVFIAFGAYHLFETYLISPMVYGNRLRVSGIVVLSSLIAGGTVGGIIGAIAILPIVASYPVIEAVWLSEFLGRRVVEKHKQIVDGE